MNWGITMAKRWVGSRIVGLAVLPLLVVVGCGDDDDDVAAGEDGEDTAEFCAHAEEINESADFPTEEQLERYKELAPDAIREDAQVVADAFIDAGIEGAGELFTDADIVQRLDRLEEYEADECGFDTGADLPPGVSHELDEDAQRVDVIATDYDFEFDVPSAGAVSFVMANEGDEPHFMGIGKLVEGVTLDEVLESDDPESMTELVADSDVVGPGGEAVLTFEDLEPGEYGMVCFIPSPDGTPHAFLGMAVPFTVAG